MNIPSIQLHPAEQWPTFNEQQFIASFQRLKQLISPAELRIWPNWLTQCVDWIKQETPHTTPANTVNDVIQQFLQADLSEISPNVIVEWKQRALWKETLVVQVMNVMEIGVSVQSLANNAQDELNRRQYGGSGPIRFEDDEEEVVEQQDKNLPFNFSRSMLKFELSDGHVKFSAVEKKPIPKLSLHTPLGTKLIVKGPLQIRRGILFLEPQNVTVLGGMVEEMNPSIQAAGGPLVMIDQVDGLPRYDLVPDLMPRFEKILNQCRNGAPVPNPIVRATVPRPVAAQNPTVVVPQPARPQQAAQHDFKSDDLFVDLDMDVVEQVFAKTETKQELEWDDDPDLEIISHVTKVERSVKPLDSDDDVIDLVNLMPISPKKPRSQTSDKTTVPNQFQFKIVDFSTLNVKSVQTAAGKEKQWNMSMDIVEQGQNKKVAISPQLLTQLIGYTPVEMRQASTTDPNKFEQIKESILKLEELLETKSFIQGVLKEGEGENSLPTIVKLGPPFDTM